MGQVPKHPSQQHSAGTVSFSLILVLFLSSRLMMLLAFPLENLITYGDYQHYFNLASLSRAGGCTIFVGTEQGCYPFIDYWYEFPPIFAYMNIAIYSLAGAQLKNYIFLLSLVLLLVECGNLYLLYRLAFGLFGRSRALNSAWIYTALFIPIFFWLGNFDALTTFFILLGLYSIITNRKIVLGLALGLGTMTKFIPALLIATVGRAHGIKPALLYTGTTLAISLVILGPFVALSPRFTLASLGAQAGKSSYLTVWALVDGNRTTGNFGPLIDHFEPAKADQPISNPARIPRWLSLLPFLLLGLYIFIRPVTLPDRNLDSVIFTTLAFVIFFLWSQGWSPQWQTFLIPLLLLALPEKRAVLFIVALGFVNFLEWPVILSRGLNDLLPLTIIIRTLILVVLAIELYQKLTFQAKDKVYSKQLSPNES